MTTSIPCSLASFQFTHPGRGATAHIGRGEVSIEFQFTHPGRGATLIEALRRAYRLVSIHAPREGCD